MENIITNLTSKEIQTLEAIEKLGVAPVSVIAKKSKLKRTTIYNFIDKLLAQKLIFLDIINGKKFYKLADEVNFLLFKKPKNKSLKNFLYSGFNVLTDKKMITKAIEKSLGCKEKKVYWMADSKTTTDIFGNHFIENYIIKAAKKKIYIKTLRSSLSKGAHRYHNDRQIKKLRRDIRRSQIMMPFHSTIIIYDDTVLFITTLNSGSIIDKELADTFKNLFLGIWKYSKVLGGG